MNGASAMRGATLSPDDEMIDFLDSGTADATREARRIQQVEREWVNRLQAE